ELARFVVGERVAIEEVGQVEASGADRQALREELGSHPRLAKVDFILPDQASGVRIEKRERGNLRIRRRAAQSDDIGEETRVLREAGGEEQISGRQLVRVIVGFDAVAPG